MLRSHCVTYCGDHAENEDAVLVHPHPQDGELLIAALADGQGGRAGGAQAARKAVDACHQAAAVLAPKKLLRPAAWEEIARRADQAVTADETAGLTTLVALATRSEFVVGASSGDSAAVLFQHDQPPFILTERQPKNPPVGCGQTAFRLFSARLSPPWRILMMSDGVWKYAGWEAVLNISILTVAADVAAALADRVRLPSSGRYPDDFSLAVLDSD